MVSPAYRNAALPRTGTGDFSGQPPAVLLWGHWATSGNTNFDEIVPQEKPQQSPDQQNRTYWDEDDKSASGWFVLDTNPPNSDNSIGAVDEDQDAHYRMILLAKKYASEKIILSKEDNARLEMINQKMDRRYPRYSAKDWQLLDEAKALIDEFSVITGAKS